MTIPMTFANGLTELKTLTSQTGNFTFSDDELTQALTFAWNDAFVVTVTWDSSLSYTDGTWRYAIPSGSTVVREVYYQSDTTQPPQPLSPDLYDIINGYIQFRPAISRWMMTGMTIYLKNGYKLTVSDSLPTANMVNYVLYTAAEKLISALVFKSAFVFLRNDTSMSDISRGLQIIQNEALRYKQALLRQFESA